MAEKDDPEVQKKRIKQIVAEMCPSAVVHFVPAEVPSWIKFMVVYAAEGVQHESQTSDDLWPSVIADISDEKLGLLISSLFV
jgi:hypothetical protein